MRALIRFIDRQTERIYRASDAVQRLTDRMTARRGWRWPL